MAAFAAVCDIAGKEACRLVAETFGGVEHRVELVECTRAFVIITIQ
jgi:hypothetical protein